MQFFSMNCIGLTITIYSLQKKKKNSITPYLYCVALIWHALSSHFIYSLQIHQAIFICCWRDELLGHVTWWLRYEMYQAGWTPSEIVRNGRSLKKWCYGKIFEVLLSGKIGRTI